MKSNDMIFGMRAVIEAIEAGKEVDKIFLKKDLQGDNAKELYDAIKGRNIPLLRVPIEKLNRFTRKNHQGIVAIISPISYQSLAQILPGLYEAGKTPFIVVLDGITDVRNFGAIARTCECAGADALVIPQTGSVSVGGDAVKTSAGALLRLPVCRERNLKSAIQFLKDSGLKLIAASEKATQDYTAVSYSDPIALIMGSEDKGIAMEHLSLCDETVSIPIRGKIASLNVSVAAGVIMYEVLKQR